MKLLFSQKNSIIHSMHSLSILIWALSITLAALLFSHPLFLLSLFFSVLLVIIASKSLKEWLSLLKFFVFMALLIVFINSFASQYGASSFSLLPVSIESIAYGLNMALRLVIIVSAFSVFTFTANPDHLLNALSQSGLPFKFLLVLMLSLRFVPVLSTEAETIRQAQQVRGLSIEKAPFIERTKKSFYFLFPMLFSSMEKSVSLSESMESRAFGSKKRSHYNAKKLSSRDLIAIIFCIIFAAFSFYLIFNSIGVFSFYPKMQSINLPQIEFISLLAVFILSASITLISMVKKLTQ